MSQKQEVKDILESENVKLNDISKIQFCYQCRTVAFDDEFGIVMRTITGRIAVTKEQFYLLINDELTREEEAHFRRREEYEILKLIPKVLLNIYEEWLNSNRQIKINRVICIDTNDTSKPTIKIQKGEIDYPITDTDIINNKCRDMLLAINLIKKHCANTRIVDIKDERIDLLVQYANELRNSGFDNLHREQDQIERYLYELTISLDNETRAGLYKYTSFRCWWVLANKKELSRMYKKKRSNKNEHIKIKSIARAKQSHSF